MIYLELFLGFLRVGCFAFGGAYGAIPLIRDVVLSHGWLDDEALACMIAVSESTPGPIMVNLATYVGSARGGLPGALLATLAVVLPSFLVILAVTAALGSLLKNRYFQAVLRGVKPCIIGVILATGCFMTARGCLSPLAAPAPDLRPLAITLLLAGALAAWKPLFRKKLTPVGLILLSACLGVAVYGF